MSDYIEVDDGSVLAAVIIATWWSGYVGRMEQERGPDSQVREMRHEWRIDWQLAVTKRNQWKAEAERRKAVEEGRVTLGKDKQG